MSDIFYFAYGSNMLAERLQARCPSARVYGNAVVQDWTVRFWKLCRSDDSGKATLLPSYGKIVQGIVFIMDDLDLRPLDKAESRNEGYGRHDDFKVTLIDNGKVIETAVFIAQPEYMSMDVVPFDWYKGLLVAGALQNNLDSDYVTSIVDFECCRDEDLDRRGRQEALKRLSLAGIEDMDTFLRDMRNNVVGV